MQKALAQRWSWWVAGCVALAVASGAGWLSACAITPDDTDARRQEVLRTLVAAVIIPTYDQLAEGCAELSDAAGALDDDPSEATLRDAQEAFRAAIAPWKRSEAFYFGPVVDFEVTGQAIDSWPADAAKLDALVVGDAAVDLTAVRKLGANQRGFPGIEHLLFDSAVSEAEVLARFTDAANGGRRRELLVSLAQDLADKTKALREAWGEGANGEGGYGRELGEAGVDSETFRKQRDGIDEVVTGMVYLAELMVMNKFAKPLGVETDGEVQPALEESPRSDGTLASLRNNLLGLHAVYEGTLGDEGADDGEGDAEGGDTKRRSLSDEVRAKDAELDDRFKAALADAIDAVDAVPPPFRETLVADAAPIHEAYQKARAVKAAIIMELAGALGASIGFGYSDTD